MTESSAVSLVRLMQASHTITLEQLPQLVADHAASAGMHDTAVFLVDVQETVLRELTGWGLDAGEGGQEFTVSGSLPGQAYQRVEVIPESTRARVGDGARRRWWVAITDGVERLGVLRADTDTDTEPVRQALKDLASMVALLLLSKRSFSDSYARLVRTEPMNVAAEMQWNLTPPPAYAGHATTVGAVMEPAYQVGGDAFDYAVAGHTLHLGVFDAMGHDTTAGITANVAVAACRNARRQGATLAETSQAVERALIEQFNAHRYVTAILADLDMESGRLTWINRGHHLPILIRDSRWTSELACPPAGPMGTGLGLPIIMATEQLEPGDRLLLYTDGIVEARDARGVEFGRDRFVDFIRRHHSGRHTLHETLRRLMTAVMEHHDGKLDDDAAVLLTEWRGGHQQELIP
ncbi:PP2C family protein-serine/threonine phosphatase [Streptomyces griseomycini]|uniref:Serine phosphatase RsbU (Regulator of sigma subunit) n=2 Tax=Streptomyces griseomycini TaxID=66895 RepID=A0A7W7PXY3_9ACTN|nr:PP2C family protein-serine/threonine phosphatase [Streptomyces griseomycini]MBB4903367.1 serine phosphatase RsbU (regulator of sigma subunit) [Streptomyces griseomycini]